MKKSVLFFLFVAFAANLMAQSVVLSEPYSNTWARRSFIFGTPIGQDAEQVYYYLNTGHDKKNLTDHIYVLDKNSMDKSDIAVTVDKDHNLLGGLVSDNNIVLLYYILNKKGDQVTFSILSLDKSDNSATLTDNNSVTTSANSKFWPDYKTAKSPDGKLLAALVTVTGKNSQLENLFAMVVNDEGEFVWSGQITPDFGGKTFSLGNMVVDNSGNIYLPAYTCQMTGKNISNVKFLMIRANGDGTNSFSDGVDFGTPQNFTAKVLKDGNIAVAGYFTESMTNTATNSSGYFIYKFDNSSENITDMRHYDFSDSYVEKAAWARFATVLGNQQYSINADDIFELDNGSLVLCGEHKFTKEIYDAQMHSYSYQILTKNILVSTFLPDGSANFMMIEKQQGYGVGRFPYKDWRVYNISYTAFAHHNDMYFMFNDDIKNIPYPGKDVLCSPSALKFKDNNRSVLMRLTPDQNLTQRVLPDPKQLLRGVEFTDSDSFYASGFGTSQVLMTKFAIEE
jgi:hypothetical protein